MANANETSPASLPVLVATRQTQGQRRDDFCWCDEGEPVRFTFECDGETVDGRCGCRRSMSGLSTKKATTTMRVQRLPITRGQFVTMLKESFANSGFTVDCSDVADEAEELLRLAAAFPENTIVEKRGTSVQSRRRAS
jgi:hypothetical protein